MANMTDFNALIKKTAEQANEAGKPTDVFYGVVKSVSPLKIQISQTMILDTDFLVLTRNVTDYTVNISVNHKTESYSHTHTIQDTYSGGGAASIDTHTHDVVGTKLITIQNSLNVGENVLLIRKKGGQKFIVLDRVVGV